MRVARPFEYQATNNITSARGGIIDPNEQDIWAAIYLFLF